MLIDLDIIGASQIVLGHLSNSLLMPFRLFFKTESRVFLLYLLGALIIAMLLNPVSLKYYQRKFCSYLLNSSSLLDMKMICINRLLVSKGFMVTLVSELFITKSTYFLLSGTFGIIKTSDAGLWGGLFLTFLYFVCKDFYKFFRHYLFHRASLLWQFHKIHHSARVLSPFTVYRVHPVYAIIQSSFSAVFMGIIMGVAIYFTAFKFDPILILNLNIFEFIFHAFGSPLRHSPIWISYGRHLEHIFMSPAQHQIHHSRDPKHLDKNLGVFFSLWDWMFGTLCVTDREEKLKFGIADSSPAQVKQQQTLYGAYLEPLQQASQIIKAQLGKSVLKAKVRQTNIKQI